MVGSTKSTVDSHQNHDHQQPMNRRLIEGDGDGDDSRRRHHGDGDEEDESVLSPYNGVHCAICLDLVSDNNGSRSIAKLQCGHEFHLDCIGSAFNAKGAMQCPNCRNVERGQWLYANASTRSFLEWEMDSFLAEGDNDPNYPETPYAVHWCPYRGWTQIGSFEELDSLSTANHYSRLHPSVYGEHPSAHLGTIPPASSRSNDNVDGPISNHHGNGVSGGNEVYGPALPAMNVQYHSWGHYSPSFSMPSSHVNGADPASAPPLTSRSSNSDSNTRIRSSSFPPLMLFGPRAGPTAVRSIITPNVHNHHPGSSAQTHERVHISHPFHYQQQSNSSSGGTGMPTIHENRRFDGPRGLPSVVPAPSQLDHSFELFTIPLGDNSLSFNRVDAWERELISQYPHVGHGR